MFLNKFFKKRYNNPENEVVSIASSINQKRWHGEPSLAKFVFEAYFMGKPPKGVVCPTKVLVVFNDQEHEVFCPLILDLWDFTQQPKYSQSFKHRSSQKDQVALLGTVLADILNSFANHYRFANGYHNGCQLARIEGQQTYQQFHDLFTNLCVGSDCSAQKIDAEALSKLKYFVQDNAHIDVREPLKKLLAGDHGNPEVFGYFFS